MGIAAGQVVWVALCRGDLRLGRVAGVASVALCGWRRVIGIADACRVGGAVSLGLVSSASCGWRRVIRIADEGVVWVAPCH